MYKMILGLIISILLGICLGLVSGLTPGIHINLISALILTLSPKLLEHFPTLYLATCLIAMGITHTFLDILPTTFLGAADSENTESLLPSHKLLLAGRAKESISLAIIGGFLGLIIILILTPFLITLIPKIYPYIQDYIPHILVFMILITIYQSKDKRIALTIFLLSGVLGIITFSLKNVQQPLLPLLSGLFGVSALILGIKNNIKIPEQNKNIELNLSKLKIIKNLISSTAASILTSFLPGLTSSHTTIISSAINKIEDDKDYIIINNSITTISMFISVIAIYSIEKARNGMIVALSNILKTTEMHIYFFAAVALITTFISIFLTFKLTDLFVKIAPKVNYQILCLIIICFMLILTILISGPIGLLILITSTSIGIIAASINIERTHLMGVLILPIIFYFIL